MVNHNLNYIKSSFIWDWSHICSSNGLEMRATHRISVIGQQYKICIFVQNRLLLQIYVKDKWLGRDQWNFHTKNFMKISFRNFFQIEDILCSSGEMRFSFVAFEKNHTVLMAMMMIMMRVKMIMMMTIMMMIMMMITRIMIIENTMMMTSMMMMTTVIMMMTMILAKSTVPSWKLSQNFIFSFVPFFKIQFVAILEQIMRTKLNQLNISRLGAIQQDVGKHRLSVLGTNWTCCLLNRVMQSMSTFFCVLEK